MLRMAVSTSADLFWPKATSRLFATGMYPVEFAVMELMIDEAEVASTPVLCAQAGDLLSQFWTDKNLH